MGSSSNIRESGLNYNGLPEALREGARRWIEGGIVPGGFLCAVIRNNLVESFFRADDENCANMIRIVRWWYNEPPSTCWGSMEKFNAWKDLFSRPPCAGADGLEQEEKR